MFNSKDLVTKLKTLDGNNFLFDVFKFGMPFYNDTGEDIPKNSVVRIGGFITEDVYKARKVQIDDDIEISIVLSEVKSRDYGICYPPMDLNNKIKVSIDGTPSVGDIVGAADGSFKLKVGNFGFIVLAYDSVLGVAQVRPFRDKRFFLSDDEYNKIGGSYSGPLSRIRLVKYNDDSPNPSGLTYGSIETIAGLGSCIVGDWTPTNNSFTVPDINEESESNEWEFYNTTEKKKAGTYDAATGPVARLQYRNFSHTNESGESGIFICLYS